MMMVFPQVMALKCCKSAGKWHKSLFSLPMQLFESAATTNEYALFFFK